jgi:hypothetical protein
VSTAAISPAIRFAIAERHGARAKIILQRPDPGLLQRPVPVDLELGNCTLDHRCPWPAP